MSYLIAILAVGVLIALHEAGHFFAARAMGMRVLCFSIGFFTPIATWTSKKSGTAYQLGILPLGGFVQIKGMNPFEDDAFTAEDSYQTKPRWKRAVVVAAGPFANLACAFLMFTALFTIGSPEERDEAGAGAVDAGSPADVAGLHPGNRITTVEGQSVSTFSALRALLEARPKKPTRLDVVRGDERLALSVTPRDDGGKGRIGIRPPTQTVSLPLHKAAIGAAYKCHVIVIGSLKGMWAALSGRSKDVETVGPVGIVKMASTALSVGATHFLAFVSQLSLMLYILNLFPLPALDGGRLVFLCAEAITRRRIPPKVDAGINTVGFVLLIGLLVLMTVKDIFF